MDAIEVRIISISSQFRLAKSKNRFHRLWTLQHVYWDVFDPSGALRTIRGYVFSIDTGAHKPTCCKPPRYGPHESEVMRKLLDGLEAQGVIEDDFGPYGAMIVLAAKPNQGHVHWTEYTFRLCVSFRLLNAVTRPFQFPIPRCDDEAEKMGDAENAITADLDSGYWQVTMQGFSHRTVRNIFATYQWVSKTLHRFSCV